MTTSVNFCGIKKMCPSTSTSFEPTNKLTHPEEVVTSLPIYAGAVVTCPNGSILCQLRDDKPGIKFPGFWTCSPGGHVEPGEPPHSAIIRELHEEFEIEVVNLKSLLTITEYEYTVQGVYHAFTAELVTPVEEVRCNEGQCIRFYRPEEVLNLINLHPVSLRIFLAHLETKNKTS